MCNPNLSLKEKMKAFGASTLSSATWLSGCLAEVFAVSPVDLYRRAKHRLARHFARFESDNPVFQMMVCRDLAWWRQEQRVWGKTKFGGAHPQRFNAWRWESCLERAYGCTRLERRGPTGSGLDCGCAE